MPAEASDAEGGQGNDDRQALWLAIVFGLVSVPWTYGFEQAAGLPLWPSFIASASFFAAGGGSPGAARSLAGTLVGALYAAATLALAAWAGGGAVALSVTVGAFMLLASLHAFVPGLSFTPAGFFGFAVLFSVHAAGVSLGASGLTGELIAAGASLAIGTAIGWLAEAAAGSLASGRSLANAR